MDALTLSELSALLLYACYVTQMEPVAFMEHVRKDNLNKKTYVQEDQKSLS